MRFMTFGAVSALLICSAAYAQAPAPPAKVLAPSEVITLEPEHIRETIKVTAQSEPSARKVVSAEIAGRISLMVLKSGDRVVAGQNIALFDTQDLELALERNAAALESAQANLDQARRQADRETELRGRGITSSKAMEDANFELKRAEAAYMQATLNLDQAKRDLDRATITSPISGVVVRHDIDEGERVSPGTVLYTVVNGETLDLKVTIAEGEARSVRGGEPLRVWPPGKPSEVLQTDVTSVDPVVDGTNRSVTAHAMLDVSGTGWRAGEFLLGEIVLREVSDALVLPAEAILKEDDNSYVMEIHDGKAIKTQIGHLTEWKSGAMIQIGTGLKPGDMVLLRPLKGVDDGTPVQLER